MVEAVTGQRVGLTLVGAGAIFGAVCTAGACTSASSTPLTPDASQEAAVDSATPQGETGGPEAAADAGTSADSESSEAGDDGGCDPDAESPSDLSCTGLYADWSQKTVASDVTAYTPAFILWSDGAQKSRWIYFPPGSTIDTSDMDDWTFPVGTKVWKEFRWPEADAGTTYAGVPAGQRIETRLLWKKASGWDVLDYRWSADESSAPLFLEGATNVLGTTYEIPATSECPGCHLGRNDFLLGFDLIGTGAPGAEGLTLAAMAAGGRLTHPPPATTIQIPEDATGLAAPALGFLHVNCGASCHNTDCGAQANGTTVRLKLLADQLYPEGGTGTVDQLDTYTTTVNKTASLMPNGNSYLLIDPGHADESLLPLMDLARDPDAGGFLPMPPIVSHIPDPVDVAKEEAWINAL